MEYEGNINCSKIVIAYATTIVAIVIIGLIYWWYTDTFKGAGRTKIVAVLHYADWCPHCRAVKPIWQGLIGEMRQMGVEMRMNDEQKKPTPNIRQIPTIIKYGGKYAEIYNGPHTRVALKRWLLSAPSA